MTMYLPPICAGCTHFRARGLDPDADFNTGSCDAFPAKPNGIPVAIYQSKADHRKPYAGDNGIVFAPKDPTAAQYAAKLFARKAS
jgi:hypothetical protein